VLLYNTSQYNITRKIYKNEYICVLFVNFFASDLRAIHRFKERKLKLDSSIFKIGCFRILI